LEVEGVFTLWKDFDFPFDKEELEAFGGRKIRGTVGGNWGVRFEKWSNASDFVEELAKRDYYVMVERPHGTYFNVWFRDRSDLPEEDYRWRKAQEDKEYRL